MRDVPWQTPSTFAFARMMAWTSRSREQPSRRDVDRPSERAVAGPRTNFGGGDRAEREPLLSDRRVGVGRPLPRAVWARTARDGWDGLLGACQAHERERQLARAALYPFGLRLLLSASATVPLAAGVCVSALRRQRPQRAHPAGNVRALHAHGALSLGRPVVRAPRRALPSFFTRLRTVCFRSVPRRAVGLL